MAEENIHIYDNAARHLGLDDSQKITLFNHARSFHALQKLLKLKQQIDTLINFDIFKLKTTAYLKSMANIYNEFNDKKPETITYADIIKVDGKAGLLVT